MLKFAFVVSDLSLNIRNPHFMRKENHWSRIKTFVFQVCCAALAAAEPEAKADADPALLYGGYAGYPYAGLGYGYGAYGLSYAAPYTYYGKRSADAEPEADADAYYLGGYGLGYGYGGLYGGYGYRA